MLLGVHVILTAAESPAARTRSVLCFVRRYTKEEDELTANDGKQAVLQQ